MNPHPFTQQIKFIVSRSARFLLPYITFPVFDFIHLFIREASTDLTWRFESNTGIITFICFSTGRAIVMAIKGEAEMPALHRSRFIFACSLGIGRHFYAIKCTRSSKPESRKLTKGKKVRKYLSCRNRNFT